MDCPSLQKMLAEVPTIRPAYLATWKVDRLSRNFMEIRHRLIAAGVRIHYIEGRPERGLRVGPHGVSFDRFPEVTIYTVFVELGGFEPPTFSLRTRRATNCAIAPSAS